MSFLTIAGIIVPVAASNGGGEDEPVLIGSSEPAFAGNLISTRRGRRRRWSFNTVALPQATHDAIDAATASGAFVECSGSALAGAVFLCEVTVTSAGFVKAAGGTRRVLTLRLLQV